MIAGGGFGSVAAGDAGGLEEKGRGERAIRRVEVFVIENVTAADREGEVIAMFAIAAAETAVATAMPAMLTGRRAAGRTGELGGAEAPGFADAEIDAHIAGSGDGVPLDDLLPGEGTGLR